MHPLHKVACTNQDTIRTAKSRQQTICRLSAFLLVFTLSTLTTIAKIVTYTPITVSSSVQYESQGGRRVIPKERSRIDAKKLVAQSPVPVEPQRPLVKFVSSKEPEISPVAICFLSPSPLRSPPVV